MNSFSSDSSDLNETSHTQAIVMSMLIADFFGQDPRFEEFRQQIGNDTEPGKTPVLWAEVDRSLTWILSNRVRASRVAWEQDFSEHLALFHEGLPDDPCGSFEELVDQLPWQKSLGFMFEYTSAGPARLLGGAILTAGSTWDPGGKSESLPGKLWEDDQGAVELGVDISCPSHPITPGKECSYMFADGERFLFSRQVEEDTGFCVSAQFMRTDDDLPRKGAA